MNRQTLAEATSLHDGAVPNYLMENICEMTRASGKDSEKIADFLMGRVGKTNLNVKLKALQIISVLEYCLREGTSDFADAIRKYERDIVTYLQYTGPPDPTLGDEKYRRIRVASQEALVCLNDGNLSRHQLEQARGNAPVHPPMALAAQNLGGSMPPQQHWGNEPSRQEPAAPQYTHSQPSHHSSGPQPSVQHASGFQSWSQPPVTPSVPETKAVGAGTWSNSGYQKKETASAEQRFSGSRYSRDNRPTVLVGQSLNFPKPTGGFASSRTGAAANSHRPSMSNSVSGGVGPSTHRYNHTSTDTSQSNLPKYMSNMNKMLNSSLPANIPSKEELHTTKLGKTVEGLQKWSHEAVDMYHRRNMDKSIGYSLADHDELHAGPSVIDRGYQQSLQHNGTGGGDTSHEYERNMIDNLCASVGLARAPPSDALQRFVELAQTLDSETIGDILLDKLEDDTWQVRLKALYVVLALLKSANSAPYVEWFEANVEVIEHLARDAKPTVVSKAKQVLRELGVDVGETASAPARRSRPRHTQMPASRQKDEVDFLGFDGLSVQDAPPAVETAPSSLLDGFETASTASQQVWEAQQYAGNAAPSYDLMGYTQADSAVGTIPEQEGGSGMFMDRQQSVSSAHSTNDGLDWMGMHEPSHQTQQLSPTGSGFGFLGAPQEHGASPPPVQPTSPTADLINGPAQQTQQFSPNASGFGFISGQPGSPQPAEQAWAGVQETPATSSPQSNDLLDLDAPSAVRSPVAQHEALKNYGKDLFNVGTSPRNSPAGRPGGSDSAFSFM